MATPRLRLMFEIAIVIALVFLVSSCKCIDGEDDPSSLVEKRTLQITQTATGVMLLKGTSDSTLGGVLSQQMDSFKGLKLRRLRRADPANNANVEQFIADTARAVYIQNHLKDLVQRPQDISSKDVPLKSGRKLDTLNYVVLVLVGGQPMNLVVDTGSDLTWVQTNTCTSCYQQQDSMYNPSSSTTYSPLDCKSSQCTSLDELSTSCSTSNACSYDVSYGDGSYTRGTLAQDTLGLSSEDEIQNFTFGCGLDSKGLFGSADGLLGLGKSSPSLISQTFTNYSGMFSYCLPSAGEVSGSLHLGDLPTYSNSTNFVYANMVETSVSTYYFVSLLGVSVGGVFIPAKNATTPVTNARILYATNAVDSNATTADANAPEANAPDATSPGANAPVANAPGANSPVANAPYANAPNANAPDATTPGANAPEANAPAANTPAANAPYANAPIANSPVANAPVANSPYANAPVANAPYANAPVSNAPSANAPGANAPEANAPSANAPGANAPEANAPYANVIGANATTSDAMTIDTNATTLDANATPSKTLIDSGTVITRLYPSLYRAVKEEFSRQTSDIRKTWSFSILDTCYNLSGINEVKVPSLKFHFDGGDGKGVEVEVSELGIFYIVRKDATQVCLALASLKSEDDYPIIGNYQQQNLRVVYDVKGSRIGFAKEICK